MMKGMFSDSRGQGCFFWTSPASFCAMRRTSDQRYLEENIEQSESGRVGARRANVQLRVLGTV